MFLVINPPKGLGGVGFGFGAASTCEAEAQAAILAGLPLNRFLTSGSRVRFSCMPWLMASARAAWVAMSRIIYPLEINFLSCLGVGVTRWELQLVRFALRLKRSVMRVERFEFQLVHIGPRLKRIGLKVGRFGVKVNRRSLRVRCIGLCVERFAFQPNRMRRRANVSPYGWNGH